MLFLLLYSTLAPPLHALESPKTLFVLPTNVALGTINASLDPLRELTGGISVMLTDDLVQALPAASLSLTLVQPLTHKETGKVLPTSQILVGVDQLQPIQNNISFSVQNGGLIELRIAVRMNPFDNPGLYVGKLRITDYTNAIDLPITIEVLPWAKIKLAQPESTLVSDGQPPGPTAFLTTGKNTILWIASNTNWRLLLSQATDLVSHSLFEEWKIPASDLKMRIFPSDWVFPLYDNYTSLGQHPLEFALGKATGKFSDGWIPIVADFQLPFTRTVSAGNYLGSLEFVVHPQ